MDYKKDIEKLLDILKLEGHSRAKIESRLGYSPNAIDQSLSRGGSKKLLSGIELYKEAVLNNSRGTSSGGKLGGDYKLSSDGLDISLNDYISEIKRQRDFAETLITNYLAGLSLNLNTALGGVEQLSLHVESAREVMFDSLDRLEKKPAGSLKTAADKIVRQLMKEQSKRGKHPVQSK